MSIIDSVKSDNESFVEQDSGYLGYGSAMTNSFSRGKRSEENSFLDGTKKKIKKIVKSKNFFSFNTNGKLGFNRKLFIISTFSFINLILNILTNRPN
jgi:hypothetical protein